MTVDGDVDHGVECAVESDVGFGVYNISAAHRYSPDGLPMPPAMTQRYLDEHAASVGLPLEVDPAFIEKALPSFAIDRARSDLGYDPAY